MLGSFIIIVLGICLGLCQVCRLSLFIKIAKKPSILFSPHSFGHDNYGRRTQNLGSPASSDAGVIAFFVLLTFPFIVYDNTLQALSGAELKNSSLSGVLSHVLIFAAGVSVGEKSSQQFKKVSSKIMSRLIASNPVDAHPLNREDLKPKYKQYENYEDFSSRRRREAWESSFFAKGYASYDDYAAKHGSPKAKSKTRSYKKAKTQSVPHTPRIGAMRVLGLSGNPSAADIKSAYRKLARKHHPDNFATQGPQAVFAAEAKMKDINAAYEFMKR